MKHEDDLINYVLSGGRGFGKTEIILNGANNVPGSTVICSNHRQIADLQRRAPNVKFITIDQLPSQIGTDQPAVFDHFAYLDLWNRREFYYREKIKELEENNGKLRFELEQLKEPTIRDAQAEFEAGACDAFNWIGDRRYNRLITPERLMQLWREGKK